MHKSEAEMKMAAKPVRYEWRQFTWAAGLISEREPWYARSGTGTDLESEDAVVEILLLHARALRDFLNRRRPLSKLAETDILAADYFDAPADWALPTFNYLIQVRTKERLDRALAHITYDRVGYESTGKGWDLPAIISEIREAWTSFLRDLPEERRGWFASELDDEPPPE